MKESAERGVPPPLVRVYVPTYKRPAFLPRALAALRAQTCSRWICEVHNDAPNDPEPAQIVASLGDSRISLVQHSGNLGATATFNGFFREIPEPFFSILEDDNYWEEGFLSAMLAAARAEPSTQVFWANMRIVMEEEDGRLRDTARTVWPLGSGAWQRMAWGHVRQLGGSLHSNGSALFRSESCSHCRTPAVPFAAMEAFRDRMLPHPLSLLEQPLAAFTVTRQTSRSRDPHEWAEIQAMLVATFFTGCPWSPDRITSFLAGHRAFRPQSGSNLVLAALADRRCAFLLRHVRGADWLVVVRGLLRRPSLLFRLRRSRQVHADWWRFLDEQTAQRWRENRLVEGTNA